MSGASRPVTFGKTAGHLLRNNHGHSNLSVEKKNLKNITAGDHISNAQEEKSFERQQSEQLMNADGSAVNCWMRGFSSWFRPERFSELSELIKCNYPVQDAASIADIVDADPRQIMDQTCLLRRAFGVDPTAEASPITLAESPGRHFLRP